MVDDGYLVGYEDGSGNFVEVGRFNNTSKNVSDPLIIQHTNSGQKLELGPNGFSTESVSTNSLSSDIQTADGNEVSASRSLGSVYQNTTDNFLEVTVVIDADNVVPDVTFARSTTNSLGTADDEDRFTFRGVAGSGFQILASLGGIIPPGEYYGVREGIDNNAVVLNWYELEFTP